MSSFSSSSDPEILLAAISGQQISKVVLFSGLSIAIYDHLLLLPAEIEKIWKAKLTPVKFFHIANRVVNWLILIVTFANNYGISLSSSFCKGSAISIAILGTLSLIINQWILLLRVDACYKKRFTRIMTAWFALTVLLAVVINLIVILDLVEHLVSVPVVRCIPTQPITHWASFVNVPYLLFETTMFVAMVWRYLHSPERDYGGGNLLLYAIFHNAVIYFVIILGNGVISTLISNFGPSTIQRNIVVLATSINTSALSRSILDLRSIASNTSVSLEMPADISLPRHVSFPARLYVYEDGRPMQLG